MELFVGFFTVLSMIAAVLRIFALGTGKHTGEKRAAAIGFLIWAIIISVWGASLLNWI